MAISPAALRIPVLGLWKISDPVRRLARRVRKRLLKPFVRGRQLQTIESLSRSFAVKGLACYFVGGYALDALRGRITREHRDLDLVLLEAEREPTFDILEDHGFSIRMKAPFVWIAIRDNVTIDLFCWKDAGAGMIQHVGSCGVGVRLPGAFWTSGREIALRGARFTIPSNDYLACMWPLTHEEFDIKFGNELPTSAPLQCRVQTERMDGMDAKIYEFTPGVSQETGAAGCQGATG